MRETRRETQVCYNGCNQEAIVSPPHRRPPSGVASMDPAESGSHSFIIRIWMEETAEEAGTATWRGHITHVTTGERHYFQNLDEIVLFIAPFLEQMGVKLRWRWQLIRSLHRFRFYLRDIH